jgi:hypothetical protein
MDAKELMARFDEGIRIYRDSPGMTVTYVDLARAYEDMKEVLRIVAETKIGFHASGTSG